MHAIGGVPGPGPIGGDNPLYYRQRMAQEEGGNLGDELMAAWLTRRYGNGNKNRLRWTRTCACVDDMKGRNCASFVSESAASA